MLTILTLVIVAFMFIDVHYRERADRGERR